MTIAGSESAPQRGTRTSALSQAWADLSLRSKLLVFALALVTLPGIVFALFAFSGARAALEREVGIQLHQTAERGADALAAALARAQSDARSWASQDIMRELVVGDVDKRVSKFLRTLADGRGPYVDVLCVDDDGVVVAASRGDWIGRNASTSAALRSLGEASEALAGPMASADFGREIIEIAVPIRNPDPPGGHLGHLLLVYDWGAVQTLLDDIRAKLGNLGKRVGALVVDRDGHVIGGVSFDGQPVQGSPLAAAAWTKLPAVGYGKRKVALTSDPPVSVLVGAAAVPGGSLGWSIVFVEPSSEALAAVQRVRSRWTLMLIALLVIGLAVATLLARQVLSPLSEVTQATTAIAAHPELELPLLPVRSRNEVGQLTESFNKMAIALKRSQEEALSAAKFAFAGELAAMVAHEVRTPLSVMRSSAQMLAAPSVPHVEENAELAETIVAEVDRVERVVTGLIELARPLQQRLEATALADLMARAVAFVAAEARRQQIHISTDLGEKVPPAWCDPEQIYQVILNLVVNALQALPMGRSIWLRVLPARSDAVGFEVRDDGPGLPRDIRDRIFQPFVTGREGGSGLGLAFVDRIIKAHRGTITVWSEPDRGATFQVWLPRAGDDVLHD